MKGADDIRVVCALTGEREMPRLAWLMDTLATLDRRFARETPDVIRKHALTINGWWLHRQMRGVGDRTGFVVGKRAVRVKAERGTAIELRRLKQVAAGKSETRWRKAFIAVSGGTRDLVWHETGATPIIEHAAGFYAAGPKGSTSILIPRLADAAALIEAALIKVEATPAEERRARVADPLRKAFDQAVRDAHDEITGYKKRGAEKLIATIIEQWPLKNLTTNAD